MKPRGFESGVGLGLGGFGSEWCAVFGVFEGREGWIGMLLFFFFARWRVEKRIRNGVTNLISRIWVDLFSRERVCKGRWSGC